MDRNPHSLADLPVVHPTFILSSQVWTTYLYILFATGWSEWLRGLTSRSVATRLLRLWVRIPPGTWMSVCCECCVLSGRGLCVGLIIRSEDTYRLWCVGIHCIRGWVGPRAGTENLAHTAIRSPDFPVSNESLYQLSYPGPHIP